MRRPDYTFPKWRKTVGYILGFLIIVTTAMLPGKYSLWINSGCLLAMIALFFPIIPAAFRQGCKAYGYYMIVLTVFVLLLIAGSLIFYINIKPVMEQYGG